MIVYNGQEYDVPVVNDAGVGEFTSNSGKKDPTGSNNERFNDYQNNTISNGTYMTVTGSGNRANNCTRSILTGAGNDVEQSEGVVIAGEGNEVSKLRQGFLGGFRNTFKANTGQSNIITGYQLNIDSTTQSDQGIDFNFISGVNWSNKKIQANLIFNYINGYDLDINGNLSSISYNTICGSSSSLQGGFAYNFINGYNHRLYVTYYSIINGSGNTIANVGNSLVIGEYNNLTGGGKTLVIGERNKMEWSNVYNLVFGSTNMLQGDRNIVLGESVRLYGNYNLYKGYGTYPSTADEDEYLSDRHTLTRTAFLNKYYPVKPPQTSGSSPNMGIIEGLHNTCLGPGTILQGEGGFDPAYNTLLGSNNVIIGNHTLVCGQRNLACGYHLYVEGSGNSTGYATQQASDITDAGTTARNNNDETQYCHIEGSTNKLLSTIDTHIEGNTHIAIKTRYSHIEGIQNDSFDIVYSHIEGSENSAEYGVRYGHIEGYHNTVEYTVTNSHIEGQNNTASGGINCGHIEGSNNSILSGSEFNHSEGYSNTMNGGIQKSHVEGSNNTLYGSVQFSHVEGYNNRVDTGSQYTHIEGKSNKTNGNAQSSHAEGWGTQIAGIGSHAQNLFTAARSKGQTSIGIANIPDMANTYALIVGNGSHVATSLSEYDAESTYNTDDEVIYNGKVYKCLEDGVTGTWDSTKWDLETTEIIDGQEITRSNALTLDWSGNLTTVGNVTANGVTLTNANPNISDEYNDTATYAVGDYCIHNNTLYKCTTAVATAEDFDSAKWTVTTIGSELLLLKSAIDALAAQLNGFTFNSLISQSDYDNLVATGTVDANTIYPIPES